MSDFNIILNNRQYGRIEGEVFRVGKIVFNTINNIRGIGLPNQALQSCKASGVKIIEFHYKTRQKHIIFKATLEQFLKHMSSFEDNGLQHSFVWLRNMDRLPMQDGKSKQKTLKEVV